ncbi:hypothetical protein Syun_004038 [Stephania yunnanensis]|uniref:Uncharacterized protein n=1 Tax=Stephania yunnanensis TaxID=152371 RepID=A0AAP0Q4I2_9MAGN
MHDHYCDETVYSSEGKVLFKLLHVCARITTVPTPSKFSFIFFLSFLQISNTSPNILL